MTVQRVFYRSIRCDASVEHGIAGGEVMEPNPRAFSMEKPQTFPGRSGRFKRILGLGWCCWLGGLIAFMVPAADASGATLLLRDEAEPVRGMIIEENDDGVLLRVELPDGGVRERLILRESIDTILRPVDEERLAALDPHQPRAYRDYAEELAEKRIDPEARDTSIRLYLIAAHLAPEELGRSALLGMTPLARNATERRRFRAMAFLLDPEQNPDLLRPNDRSDDAASAVDSAATPQVTMLLRALEMLRRGRHQEANRLVRRAGVSELLEEHADILTLEEFLEACGERAPRGPEPPARLLARIVQLELRLMGGDAEPAEVTRVSVPSSGSSWGQLSPEVFHEVVFELTLKTLTEFDPRASIYRNGAWMAPESDGK